MVPRKLRVEYEGAIYHNMNRGDRREAIFLEDGDRDLFLETLGPGLRQDWLAGACPLFRYRSRSHAPTLFHGLLPKHKCTPVIL